MPLSPLETDRASDCQRQRARRHDREELEPRCAWQAASL
jgi:hypothetical protein